MAFSYCPDCGSRVYLGHKPWVGQPVGCDRCNADLEVVEVNPPQLDWTENLLDESWEKEPEPDFQTA